MPKSVLSLWLIVASVLFTIMPLAAQEEQPSLGDVARQSRIQKQKNKDVSTEKGGQPVQPGAPSPESKPALPGDTPKPGSVPPGQEGKKPAALKPAKKVITNDEIPSHVGPTRTQPASSAVPGEDYEEPQPTEGAAPADYWRTRILSQKNTIAALKSDIEGLNASIQYAGANCVSNCVEWNERQLQKQQQAETMRTQLAEQEKQLEQMQDMARKQGYGNSVYDP
jgi:hypothetical protein